MDSEEFNYVHDKLFDLGRVAIDLHYCQGVFNLS